MHADHPLVALDIAHAHQDEALHLAAIDRLGRLAQGEQPSTANRLRRLCGVTLVRLGQSIQGSRPNHDAGDLAAAAGVLRLAR